MTSFVTQAQMKHYIPALHTAAIAKASLSWHGNTSPLVNRNT